MLITDQGKCFCNKLADCLNKHLQTKHCTTISCHPQCYAQAKVCNKTIAKYLNSFVDNSTLDWKMYLPPLNPSFHKSFLNTPTFSYLWSRPLIVQLSSPRPKKKNVNEKSQAMTYTKPFSMLET